MIQTIQHITKRLETAHCILHTAYCRLLFILLFTAHCLLGNAQLFPVQVNQSITPPYNTRLNSYATATDVKLRLFLTLNDVNVNNRQVRLKLRIQGQGLNIQSPDFVSGAPQIFLNGGTQQQFTNLDLAPYFQLNNLLGINAQQYNQPLPDGSYQICWEVYDFLTNQRISNPNMGCSTIFLVLNDPPILNLPNRGDQLTDIQPTNIVFTWTPRHANATNVSYDFELRELWDTQIDPQAAFLASPNYHTETTFATTLLYNISKPPLIPGRTYAWRVRAKSTTGLSENSVFRNDGYSEIFHFTYTNACYPPTFTLAEPLNTGRVKISWQTHPDHNRYHVQYKRADVADAEWFEVFSYSNQVQISNLQDGVTYDFRVGGTCHALTDLQQAFTYSTINQFTMPTPDESVSYSCGIVPEIDITNTNPLGNIGVNETFTAGDFPVTVKQIQGGNGVFTGTGFIVVPYLADSKIAVEFSGIKINTDYQLFDGIIETTYDPAWSSVEDIGDLSNAGPGQLENIDINFPIAELPEGIQIDPNGDIIIVGQGGSPVVELPGGQDYVITDSGDPNADPPRPPRVYSVDENGNITELGEQAEGGAPTPDNTEGVDSNGQPTALTAEGVVVRFQKGTSYYAFDEVNANASAQEKELYTKLAENYYVPAKLIVNGKEGTIIAEVTISNDTISVDDIIFKTEGGRSIPSQCNGATCNLTIKGVFSDADEMVLATLKTEDKQQVAGALQVFHVNEKNVDITAVSVNNATLPNGLKDTLNTIFGPAGVTLNYNTDTYNVGTEWDLDGDGALLVKSNFGANYSAEQRALQNGYNKPNNNAYYLFFTDIQPSISIAGAMPIGRQFGYVFGASGQQENKGNEAQVAAHELGHGAFELQHPFGQESPEGNTDWLMDYGGGTELAYIHWQQIHNPNLRIGLFDSDESSQSVTSRMHQDLAINKKRYSCNNGNCVEDPNGNLYFGYLTPSGKRIILSQDHIPTFYHGIENDKYTNLIPGTLIGFIKKEQGIADIKYWSQLDDTGTTFSGYDNNFNYSQVTIPSDDNSVIIGLPYAGVSRNDKSWKNYKFLIDDLETYKDGNQSVMNIISTEFKALSLFQNNKPTQDTQTVSNINSLIGSEQYSITESELSILRGRYFETINITDFTTLIEGIPTVSHNEKPQIFLLIKIAEIQNRYPILFERYAKWFDRWNVYEIGYNNYLSVIQNYVDQITAFSKGEWEEINIVSNKINNSFSEYRKWKDNLVSPPGNSSVLYDFYKQFIIDLTAYTNTQSENNITCLSNLATKTYQEIIDCIEIASNDELKSEVSYDGRTQALKTLISNYGDTDVLRDREERVVTRLVNYTPPSFNEDLFLEFLLSSENVITVSDTYGDDGDIERKDYALWHLMFEKIDDNKIFYPGDNRELLIEALCKHYYKSDRFDQDLKAATDYLNNQQIQDIAKLNYVYEYDYQNIVRRGWSIVKASAANGPVGFVYEYNPNDDSFFSLDTEIVGINEIKIDHNLKWAFFDIETRYSDNYGPFDFSMFKNISKETLLKDFTLVDENNNVKAIPAPAILLHYASKTGDLQTKSDIIQTTIDVATLAIPGGQLNTLGRVFYYADKISSVASIAATGTRDQSPRISGYLNAVSIAAGFTSIGDLVANTNKLKDVIAVDAISEFNPVNRTETLADYINDIENKDELELLQPLELSYSEKILQQDLLDYQSAQIIDAARVTKLENALATIKNLGSKLKTNHLIDDVLTLGEDFDALEVASWINTNDNFLDVVIHSNPQNGKFPIIFENTNYELSANELAALISIEDNSKPIRLLSCNNPESAVELSRILNREVIGSVGEMRIYDNGYVETGQWYKASPDGSLDEFADIPTSGLSPTSNSILLRAGFVDNIDGAIRLQLQSTLGSRFNEFMDMIERSNIPSTWKFENINGVVTLKDKDGFEWAKIFSDKIEAVGGNQPRKWNELLNVDPPLLKDFEYVVDNNFIYKTDHLGRVKKVTINNIELKDRLRSDVFQQKTKFIKDGKTTGGPQQVDAGGHMAKAGWYGPTEQINYHSQNWAENSHGSWKQMEDAVTALRVQNPNATIKYEVEAIFSEDSKRPDRFLVNVYVNDNRNLSLSKVYLNPW